MKTNERELRALMIEAAELASKTDWTKQDEKRNAWLLSTISVMKSNPNLTLTDIGRDEVNAVEVQMGLEPTNFSKYSPLSAEKRAEVEVWQRFIKTGKVEHRDMTVGNGIPAYLKGNLGSFVPLTWFEGLFAAKKGHDALFDPDVITYVPTTKGNPMQFGMMGDTENVATLVTEAGSSSEADITAPSGIMLGAFTFRSPVFHASIEAFQDVEIGGALIEQFKEFAADRIARGVGPYLVTGTGSGQPTGLLTAIETLGAPKVVAAGSGGNDGINNGSNSVGSTDIASLYYALDEAYRDGPKCAWLMNSSTLGFLAGIVSKFGLPVVSWQGREAWIWGKPVRISPSMPNIGLGNIPICFGDLSYYVVRCAMDEKTYIKVYRELPGLAENGKIGLRAYVRYDGQLQYNDTGSPAPIVYLANQT
jgi:HK97 family phage major capsid protein